MVLRNLVCLNIFPLGGGDGRVFQNDAARTDVDQPLSSGSFHHSQEQNPF